MARRTARKAARGAVPMDGASIRNEVAAIALVAFALLLVGVVLAANRTLAQLAAPAWDRRGAVTGLRPGVMLPGGTATKFAGAATIEDDADADADVAMGREPAQPMRINLPPERPKS